MPTYLCLLCDSRPAIEKSHVTSKLMYRAIKSDSPTGFFRNPNNPNQRLQDGDKLPLLCTDCEQRFGNAESQFASNVFLPFHKSDRDEFSYGPWLHYFMTSLAWRTLILDLPGLVSDGANPRAAVAELVAAADTMRQYLLGVGNFAGTLQNHAVVWTQGDSGSAALVAARPNTMIRRSAFGYSILDRQYGYSAILHNLAGLVCFLIVKGNPRDTWCGTKVNPSGGEMRQPQHVDSWLIGDLLSRIIEFARKQAAMSDVQQQRVRDAMRKNPSAPGLRFLELDKRFIASD
jgi:hypothetical protein